MSSRHFYQQMKINLSMFDLLSLLFQINLDLKCISHVSSQQTVTVNSLACQKAVFHVFHEHFKKLVYSEFQMVSLVYYLKRQCRVHDLSICYTMAWPMSVSCGGLSADLQSLDEPINYVAKCLSGAVTPPWVVGLAKLYIHAPVLTEPGQRRSQHAEGLFGLLVTLSLIPTLLAWFDHLNQDVQFQKMACCVKKMQWFSNLTNIYFIST